MAALTALTTIAGMQGNQGKRIGFNSKIKILHRPLMFHQSGGCCDGSQPMCFNEGEFKVGRRDVWMGTISNCNFYMGRDQFKYQKHTQLTLDITPGWSSSFSLQILLEVRFLYDQEYLLKLNWNNQSIHGNSFLSLSPGFNNCTGQQPILHLY